MKILLMAAVLAGATRASAKAAAGRQESAPAPIAIPLKGLVAG